MNVMTTSSVSEYERVNNLIACARALIFDVDGTLAETEEVHRQAFNDAFEQAGIDWCWGRTVYKELLRVTGGKERIHAFDSMRKSVPKLSGLQVAELHRLKTARYAELIAEGICPLRPGVKKLMDVARNRGQRLAVATTTSRGNIDALLSVALGTNWSARFDVIVAGDEVALKKPAPDVYLNVLSRLELEPSQCIAIEDSRNGLLAACRAGVPVLVTRSIYFHDEEFSEAVLAVEDLTELGIT